ncbi:MAG: nucleotidyltransferase domain-containing protein [Proteobacteria bacterium]|nr:nucleotidyltransferase domain-containing protein [Pseudomonadota bacterium]
MFKLLAKALNRAEQDEIISSKLAWILSHSQPQVIILFGSAVAYRMTDASDVDLIVTFADKQQREQARQELFKSRPKDDWPHDLLLLTSEEFARSASTGGGAAYVAKTEGRVIYQSRS